jgi:transcriptional regulator with XRE-family HTH domain
MPRVNPEILVWARETAGLSPQEGAKAIDLNDARGRTGAERLSALERGDEEPSRPLLLKMAQKYRRPLLTFFLDKVPRKGDRGQDFRTVPGAGLPAYDATVDALIRDINTRQSLVRSLLEDEEALPLPFIASANINQGAESVASAIRETLLLNIEEFRWQDSVESAFKHLRSRIEASGIFVLLIGNLGSHHTNISPEVFRGFAVADPIAPLVVINDQDARTAWSFTALHEIAHLWLGATGIRGDGVRSRKVAFQRRQDEASRSVTDDWGRTRKLRVGQRLCVGIFQRSRDDLGVFFGSRRNDGWLLRCSRHCASTRDLCRRVRAASFTCHSAQRSSGTHRLRTRPNR